MITHVQKSHWEKSYTHKLPPPSSCTLLIQYNHHLKHPYQNLAQISIFLRSFANPNISDNAPKHPNLFLTWTRQGKCVNVSNTLEVKRLVKITLGILGHGLRWFWCWVLCCLSFCLYEVVVLYWLWEACSKYEDGSWCEDGEKTSKPPLLD